VIFAKQCLQSREEFEIRNSFALTHMLTRWTSDPVPTRIAVAGFLLANPPGPQL